MSISRIIKLMEGVRGVAKKYSTDNTTVSNMTLEYGKAIQDRLIDGLLKGYDIDGKTFKGIKQSTINIRKREGRTGVRPLLNNGGILNFLNSSDMVQAGKVQIKLKDAPEKYIIHNEDHTVPSNANKYNTQGKFVPERKWYGIPKTYKEGGTKYDEFLKKFIKRVEEEFGKTLKST